MSSYHLYCMPQVTCQTRFQSEDSGLAISPLCNQTAVRDSCSPIRTQEYLPAWQYLSPDTHRPGVAAERFWSLLTVVETRRGPALTLTATPTRRLLRPLVPSPGAERGIIVVSVFASGGSPFGYDTGIQLRDQGLDEDAADAAVLVAEDSAAAAGIGGRNWLRRRLWLLPDLKLKIDPRGNSLLMMCGHGVSVS